MSAALSGPPEELRTSLFREAHDIRGVSGTFGLSALGEIADAICLYLDDLPPEGCPNTALLNNLVRVVQLTLSPHEVSELMRAGAECRAAVRLMRVREGRTPELS
jgi:chemotaxis protein histidine kinase CheA